MSSFLKMEASGFRGRRSLAPCAMPASDCAAPTGNRYEQQQRRDLTVSIRGGIGVGCR
jgi:hypothetical protein